MSDFIEVHEEVTAGAIMPVLVNRNQIKWIHPAYQKSGCKIAVFTLDTIFGCITVTESYEEIRSALLGG